MINLEAEMHTLFLYIAAIWITISIYVFSKEMAREIVYGRPSLGYQSKDLESKILHWCTEVAYALFLAIFGPIALAVEHILTE